MPGREYYRCQWPDCRYDAVVQMRRGEGFRGVGKSWGMPICPSHRDSFQALPDNEAMVMQMNRFVKEVRR